MKRALDWTWSPRCQPIHARGGGGGSSRGAAAVIFFFVAAVVACRESSDMQRLDHPGSAVRRPLPTVADATFKCFKEEEKKQQDRQKNRSEKEHVVVRASVNGSARSFAVAG